ncbi:MAG: uroporphyrinogen-III synthase [Nocardioidaceae bacterium]
MTAVAPVLAGCRVLVTAQRRSEELAGALARRGAEVVCAATLGVVPHIDEVRLLERTRDVLSAGLDTLVVTTGIGFRGWLDTAETAGLAEELLAVLDRTRLVARGPKARGALQAAGLRADWVAESETSAEIADFLLTEGVAGQRIGVQHHGAGDDGLDGRFSAAGATVLPLEVYRWGPPPDPDAVEAACRQVAAGCFDAVVFTSAPGAQAWLDNLDRLDARGRVLRLVEEGRLLVAAVGPVTAEPLVRAGMAPVVPERARMGALVRRVIMELGDDAEGIATEAGVLHVRAASATLDHEVLPVSPSGLAVLRRLARTPGRVVTRDEILDVLPGDAGRQRDPHTAEVAVARLREACGRRPLVRTVIKRGYMLPLAEPAP